MSHSIRPGDVLADRYRMIDLLSERKGGMFWCADDQVLTRRVAIHVIRRGDERAPGLLDAARRSATVTDARILRVLDADESDEVCYVVNEWGSGTSLDLLLADGPMAPRRAAWVVSEVADTIARAHRLGEAHGRLAPENVLIDHNGSVKIIGFAVDAALHGLPPDRRSTDVVDLAALLYACLVGKWAGISRSEVPPAPESGGVPLRPRKVRAGIPKALDTICEQVLGNGSLTGGAQLEGISSADAIHQALVEFVGNPVALAAAEAGQADQQGTVASIGAMPPVRPAGPPEAQPEPQPDQPTQIDQTAAVSFEDLVDDSAAAGDAPASAAPPLPGGRTAGEIASEAPDDPNATVAGVPVFDDEWHTPRQDTPPPPPEFEQPPERPLYAPDPVRRPRGPIPQPKADDYWPWEGAKSSGTGPLPTVDEDEDDVPGRSWLRLAAGLAAAVLLVVAAVFAFNAFQRNDQNPGGDGTASPSGDTQPAQQLVISGASDYDPEGDPPEEYPENVPNVLDKDPKTTWTTSTYKEDFGPGGLKSGVGLLFDLGDTQKISEIELDVVGAPTQVQAFVYDDAPTGVPTGDPAAKGTATLDQLVLRPNDASGRYVLVWITSLPTVSDGFRAEISRVVIRS